jgi:signal peptidase II
LKKTFKDYFLLAALAGLIILSDQLTKEWVRNNLAYSQIYRPDLWITQYVRIIHWTNTGAAFGMFGKLGNVFMVLSIAVSLAILYYFPQIPRHEWYLRLSMCLLLGGAVGNLIDRLTQGHVTDFISVGNFAVFNIADASISSGVAILFVGMLIQEAKQKRSKTKPEDPGQGPDQGKASELLPEEIQGE